MAKVSTVPKRSRKRFLLWVALIVASLLLVYSYRYDLILALPSVQADRLQMISKETRLPFPPSSQVVKYLEWPEPQGSWLDWRVYWASWLIYWFSWQYNGARWYSHDPDLFLAKIIVPDASYAELEAALLKTGPHDSYLDNGNWPAQIAGWWKPTDIKLSRQYNHQVVDFSSIIASRENGRWVVYIYHEIR